MHLLAEGLVQHLGTGIHSLICVEVRSSCALPLFILHSFLNERCGQGAEGHRDVMLSWVHPLACQ